MNGFFQLILWILCIVLLTLLYIHTILFNISAFVEEFENFVCAGGEI